MICFRERICHRLDLTALCQLSQSNRTQTRRRVQSSATPMANFTTGVVLTRPYSLFLIILRLPSSIFSSQGGTYHVLMHSRCAGRLMVHPCSLVGATLRQDGFSDCSKASTGLSLDRRRAILFRLARAMCSGPLSSGRHAIAKKQGQIEAVA